MNLKSQTIQKAVRMLAASGARFHIITEEGEVIGAPLTPEAPRKVRTKQEGPNPLDPFKAMIEGTVPPAHLILECPEHVRARLQRNTSSFLSSRFGPGNYSTMQHPKGVEVLIYDKDETPPAP